MHCKELMRILLCREFEVQLPVEVFDGVLEKIPKSKLKMMMRREERRVEESPRDSGMDGYIRTVCGLPFFNRKYRFLPGGYRFSLEDTVIRWQIPLVCNMVCISIRR